MTAEKRRLTRPEVKTIPAKSLVPRFVFTGSTASGQDVDRPANGVVQFSRRGS